MRICVECEKMGKQKKSEATESKEVVVSQGIYAADSKALSVLGAMVGDKSIAATIKRMFREQIQAAVLEAQDRMKKDWKAEG